MGLAIVAIPEEQDRVWKISSEKVPHLTLLFLGDENNSKLQQITQFVEHAVTLAEHGPFYLDVERRGELGPDKADVVFFSRRSWNLKWIKQFRAQLLQHPDIKTAYDSTEQYEEWVPHLTLGYPQQPAKPQPADADYPLYSVCFDRIAVWTGDFDGPGEFLLEWPDRDLEFDGDLSVAYSDTKRAELVHRLGQEPPYMSLLTAADRGESFVVHQSVLDNPNLAEQIRAKVKSILEDVSGDADQDVALFGDPLIRAKLQSVLSDFYRDPNIDNAVAYSAMAVALQEHVEARSSVTTIDHGAAFVDGLVHGAATAAERGEEFVLEHYGVKGMRWGQSRSGSGGRGGFLRKPPTPVAPKAESKVPHGKRRKTQIQVDGGENHPAHPEAIKVAQAQAKLKKSGPKALSNQELRDVATRVQLEQQAVQATRSHTSRFARETVSNQGRQAVNEIIRSKIQKRIRGAS